MISCTEFIPAYSELFAYLEDKCGRDEVDRFWEYLFKPASDGIPLINFVKEQGVRGCFTYWSGTLNEEAADFTMYLNEKNGWFMIQMHHCPSKGRLLRLKNELGIVPYHDYCLHCDHYRASVEKIGLKYLYNFAGTDHAACSLLIYDPKRFDGRIIPDENTVVMDRRAAENEYFHPDFHSSMNSGIHYVGEKFGLTGVKEYLTRYTEHVCNHLLEKIKERGLAAIEDKIRKTYEQEKALDALDMKYEDNNLLVTIKYCPAVRHLQATGRTVSPWYRYTTETVMEVLASRAGAKFEMQYYDEETGAARYSFT